MTQPPKNILITGAGGAAAVAFYKCLDQTGLNIHMADMSPYAAGLYLVNEPNRLLLPAGETDDYIPQLFKSCLARGIDVLVPTVDWELLPIAAHHDLFAQHGIQVVLSDYEALSICLDKYRLMGHLSESFSMPMYEKYNTRFNPCPFDFPMLAKPRRDSGSRGIRLIHELTDLRQLPNDDSYLIQQYLPGDEFSVDVYLDRQHQARASVVRQRMRVDSGVSVVGQTIHNEHIASLAADMAEYLKLSFAVNVQFKMDPTNQPGLLEINPRFPGTMSLTAAAGVNMPQLCIDEVSGSHLAEHYPYDDLAMLRSWSEQYLPAGSMQAVMLD